MQCLSCGNAIMDEGGVCAVCYQARALQPTTILFWRRWPSALFWGLSVGFGVAFHIVNSHPFGPQVRPHVRDELGFTIWGLVGSFTYAGLLRKWITLPWWIATTGLGTLAGAAFAVLNITSLLTILSLLGTVALPPIAHQWSSLTLSSGGTRKASACSAGGSRGRGAVSRPSGTDP
jgi:hypothetical protein